ATILRASWNGQAFEFSAISRRAGTWASTVDINGSPAADTKNHTRWRQSKHLRRNHSAKEDALEATGLPRSLKGSSQRREGHVQLRAETRKRGDDGDRHASRDQRVFDDRGAAFLACKAREKPAHVSSTPAAVWHGCESITGALRYRCTV